MKQLWHPCGNNPSKMHGLEALYGVILLLVASLLLVAMPFAPSSFLFLVVWPGAPSSILGGSFCSAYT